MSSNVPCCISLNRNNATQFSHHLNCCNAICLSLCMQCWHTGYLCHVSLLSFLCTNRCYANTCRSTTNRLGCHRSGSRACPGNPCHLWIPAVPISVPQQGCLQNNRWARSRNRPRSGLQWYSYFKQKGVLHLTCLEEFNQRSALIGMDYCICRRLNMSVRHRTVHERNL